MEKLTVEFRLKGATITRMFYYLGDSCQALEAACESIELEFGSAAEIIDYAIG